MVPGRRVFYLVKVVWRGFWGVTWGPLTGMLMRGREPGSSHERLVATEDMLEIWKGQLEDAGKKNCRKRRGMKGVPIPTPTKAPP